MSTATASARAEDGLIKGQGVIFCEKYDADDRVFLIQDATHHGTVVGWADLTNGRRLYAIRYGADGRVALRLRYQVTALSGA